MIRVRCMGHIGTAVGANEVEIEGSGIQASEIVDRVRELAKGGDPGFNRFNTLVMVEDGEAFVPAGVRREVRSGESVVLIPFSHGG
jgi:molybdopterin converting factor small subunit